MNYREVITAIVVDLAFLIGGAILVGLGTNFYIGAGLALLLVFNKNNPTD